jgi:hypothetical protein
VVLNNIDNVHANKRTRMTENMQHIWWHKAISHIRMAWKRGCSPDSYPEDGWTGSSCQIYTIQSWGSKCSPVHPAAQDMAQVAYWHHYPWPSVATFPLQSTSHKYLTRIHYNLRKKLISTYVKCGISLYISSYETVHNPHFTSKCIRATQSPETN